jgi:hypothetical protein
LQTQTAKKPIGPTPEQLAKGGYEKPEGKGSLAVYTNTHPDILAKLRAHATLTERLYKAGRAFEGTWCIVRGNGSPSRDSTILPIGGVGHETEGQAERWARANGRLKLILLKVGPARYNLLISVCCFGEGLGPANRMAGRTTRKAFLEALEVCAHIYGIERS